MKNVEDIYRLSPMQQGMLFHTLGAPGAGTYVEQVYWTWRGPLDLPTLQRAWQRLVDRHTPLRTAFFWENMKEPLQAVRRKVDAAPRLEDWSDVPPEAREARFAELLEREQRQDFTLSTAPLVRFTVVRLGPALSRCIVSYHHLVMDGWSLPVCLRELFLTYDALTRGDEPALEPARGYRDYIVWLSKQERADAERFWRERLRGFTTATPLAADRPAEPGAKVEAYTSESLGLGTALTARLMAFTRQHQVTLSTLVQGAWALLLGRYSGQDDVAFGTVVSGRPPALPGVDTMLGTFINTQVSRLSLPSDGTVLPWLRALQAEQLAARAFEHVSLVDVQGWSEVPRGQPLFESLLVFENLPRRGLSPEATARLPVDGFARTDARTGYPLIFVVLPDATETELRFTYDVGRFDAVTVRRMLGHMATLLQSLVDAPAGRLADVSMVSPEEFRRLAEWNDTRVEFPSGDSLHSLFEAQARRTPEAVALEFEGSRLTYAQLDARANQLAWHLRSLGVGPESRVGVCLERSLELVIALLGTLKAGAAYVPLDPGYPQERLAFMLADSAPRVLLTQEHLLPRLPASSVPRLCLDSQWPLVSGQPTEAVHAHVTPRSLAYVIYTSGSTGRPKGAMNEHGAVCNRLHWMQKAYGLGHADAVLQKTPFSFDVSVWEFIWPLMTGARLVMARPGGHQDPAYLGGLISSAGITTLHFVPSMLRAFLEEPGLGETCASVRRIVCSGEALPAELARRCLERLPEAGLHNLYGPTEAAVDVTAWQCRPGDARASVPIGRPIANTRIHLLDAALRPVPVGVPGELFIAGVQVGRGYHARPELTAERFVPDPFSPEPGARMYRTGDLARWLPDGTVDYLGRLDFQVKVRGLRIELGEIEAALMARLSVKQAVVLAREDVPGQQRLVAYVVPGDGGAVDADELRQALLRALPEYMVPSAFVALQTLPLSANGKLDRKALPVPDAYGTEPSHEYVAPRDEREQALADIWAQVLGRPRVGIHDNFFELGGDSIISLQVIARARQAGMRLTPHHVFQHRTVAELARVAQAEQPSRGAEGPLQGPVPLTPIQRFFLERPLPRPHHFNQAVLLEMREPLDAALLERALRHLVDHHDALRMRLSLASGHWEQHNAPPGAVLVLKRVDLSSVPEAGQAAALESEANKVQASLDLSEGLLLRAAFLERGPGRTARLLLVAHHLVVDGVSWRVLLEDLETACEQLRRGNAVALPPRSTSFQTWARRLEELARTEALEAELPVWLAQLQSSAVKLPVDGPGAGSGVVTVELDAEQTRLLLREVPSAYRSRPEEALLATLAQVLGRWAGPGPLRVALEGHGREDLFDDVDVSRTVGWFTSLYPVCLQVPPGATPGEALRSVRESLRALPRRGVGYGLLRYLGREEVASKLAALPEPEVAFNYLGQLDAQSSTLFALSTEPSGTSRDTGGARRYAIEVDAMVVGGKLRVSWTHSEHLHSRTTIESLARQHLETLRAVVADRGSADAARYVPSDFPWVQLDAATLERLLPPGTAVEDIFPLSPLQQGLLFHALMAPGEDLYLEQLSWAIRSPLDARALKRAWELVVAHDAMLRARFAWDGLIEPVQVVLSHVELPWTELDWRDVPEAGQPARLEAFLKEDRARSFDLDDAPLLRVALIRLGQDSWHCVWSFHHLLLDGWSMSRVLQQLFTAYAALARGQAPRLAPLPPHRDYVAWLRKQDLARSESWWRRTLEGFTTPTPLPAVRTASPGTAAEGRELELRLSAETTSALQSFARRQEVTLNTLAQAAWALVLSRHGGGEDVVFGVTVSGRPAELPGAEERVGLFINSLPARVRVEPDAEPGPWLRQLQARQVELRQHEHCPLARVQTWSGVPRGTPLFESLLVFENYPVDAALRERSLGVTVTDVRMRERTHYPLLLAVTPGQELRLQLAYETPRHDEATAARLLDQVRLALEGLAARDTRRLRDVSLLSAEERRRVLVDWNATASEYPRASTLPEVFAQVVARYADKVAVEFGDSKLTYRQLDERANQLAHHLRGLGVSTDSRVAIALERSLELIVSL
ncbi:non-ribosomal peptide synthetase, partial [Myxococcus sp. RHSTA-1-4]|uniref:non-ribosomal peptide synthetase n=1 Tax=Myxococcus sp. RHSTA-1-4 TaxID=2874601 RepID=UPI001CC14AB9